MSSEVLFPYQREGAEWLSQKNVALLADEMGLGKSAQAITACDRIGAERVLVLCPASARPNWVREFSKFSKISRTFKILQTKKDTFTSEESIVCSYDLAAQSCISSEQSFDCLILDESHFLKSLDAKRTKAVFGRQGLVRKAARVWALSGTPAPNNISELWPLLYTFGATTLTFDAFIERYCTYYISPHGRQITGVKKENLEELRTILKSISLRRKKEDVMKDLPPIFFTDITVDASPVDLEIESSFIDWVYPKDRTAELEAKLNSERAVLEAVTEKTRFTRDGMKALEALAGSVSTLRRYTGLQKVQAVADLVSEELESGAYEKIVIFAIHQGVIEGLRRKLTKYGAVTLYGGTPPGKRQINIDRFQNTKRTRVFIGNIMAAGTAITLTSAHQVLFIEQDWVPGNNAQAAMRCHRIGQTKPVTVRFVGLANSIDEKIVYALRRKTKDLTTVFAEI
jgi:SWI/SNF-related matrix-associated actin-dependent regulator 1 of chromatin subfamily A